MKLYKCIIVNANTLEISSSLKSYDDNKKAMVKLKEEFIKYAADKN